MQRLNLLFPYLLFAAVVAVVVFANLPAQPPHGAPPEAGIHCESCGMGVDPATAVRATINGTPRLFCSPSCREMAERPRGGDETTGPSRDPRIVDVVCNMEVNANWGISTTYKGRVYHFCTERCRDRFVRQPQSFLAARCLVCDTRLVGSPRYATYLGNTYGFCSERHRAEFKLDPAAFFMHSMWGIPAWLYYASIAIVLVLSFGLFEWLSRVGGAADRRDPVVGKKKRRISRDQIRGEGERRSRGHRVGGGAAAVALPVLAAPGRAATMARGRRADRFDLLSVGWVRAAFLSRKFRFVLQAFVVAAFLLIIAAGLFGNQNPALNIAPILTWTLWWGLLIVLILYAGKSWCYVCPWDAIAGWTERLSLWKKQDVGLSLNLKWPHVVRNIVIATGLFVGLTWIELGFGVTMRPRVTAYLALGMLFLAVTSALVFERKSFCRYACLVGRVSGLYALFAGTEIRSRSASVCRSCLTKECVNGGKTAYGCPTFLYPGKLAENTYCIQCMECIQACPHDNLAVNLRPWGGDLVSAGKPRRDEAYLALLMLAITGFHGLTMTPMWQQLVGGIRAATNAGRILGFSLGMGMLMLGPIIVYAGLVAISRSLGGRRSPVPVRYRDCFIRYAYALLPIALFYHIAHNSEHLLMEGPKIAAMISDPFGWGWNVLGTAGWTIPPLISLQHLWLVQVLLVLIGHVYSLWIAQRTSVRLFGSSRAAFRSQIPMLIGMICFSVFSLWLLKQPMEMRTSAM